MSVAGQVSFLDSRLGRGPSGAALFEGSRIHQQFQLLVGNVDGDLVAFFDKSNGSADCCLRRYVTDSSAVRAATEATVGDECRILAQSHTDESGGGGEHLLHTRSAFGAFVANDDHVTRMNLPIENRHRRLGFALEYACPPCPLEHLGGHRRLFDHGAFRSQIAVKNRDSPLAVVGLINSANDFPIQYRQMLDIVTHGFAGDRHGVQMDEVARGELVHDGLNTSCRIQVFQEMGARRTQTAQVRRASADLVERLEIEIDSRLMGNGRHVKDGIGGAAEGHVHGNGVFESFAGGDIARAEVLVNQVEDFHAGHFGQPDSSCGHGGNGTVAGKAHAERFSQAIHGVGGEHAGAGPATGTGVVFQFHQLL